MAILPIPQAVAEFNQVEPMRASLSDVAARFDPKSAAGR
jgi:hypothetical protein